jgi:cellulose synthase/poly-beta-1,6-N-acetylglucosamine synthase-like glycosyltransferase
MTGNDQAAPERPRTITISPRQCHPGTPQGGPVMRATPTVLIPAHNEADRAKQTLVSLKSQAQPAGRVIVIADNCTDDTARLARESGAGVIVAEDNAHRKPGALTQAPEHILPGLDDADTILIQDAGTTLVPGFVEVASSRLSPADGAVGGVFYGGPGGAVMGFFERSGSDR